MYQNSYNCRVSPWPYVEAVCRTKLVTSIRGKQNEIRSPADTTDRQKPQTLSPLNCDVGGEINMEVSKLVKSDIQNS